jgi:ketosteroid isomerase-like protein
MRSPSRLLTSLMLGLAIACAGAPAPAPDTRAADAQAIRDLDARWNDYLKTSNDSAIIALYDSAAVLMPPGMPAIRGLDNIRGFWAQIWTLKATLQLAVEDVVVEGGMAVDRGTWTWEQPGPDGSTIKDNGKYLVRWKKVNGQWKAVEDMWNSDNMPPAPAAK